MWRDSIGRLRPRDVPLAMDDAIYKPPLGRWLRDVDRLGTEPSREDLNRSPSPTYRDRQDSVVDDVPAAGVVALRGVAEFLRLLTIRLEAARSLGARGPAILKDDSLDPLDVDAYVAVHQPTSGR